MKNIVLTLIISILFLGSASFLFSLDKNTIAEKAPDKNSPAHLPESQDTAFLIASLNPNFIPIRNWGIEEPDIQAKAAGVFDLSGYKFLYQKNINEKLPIASLTKIMTAIIALENLKLDDIVTISKEAIMTEGENGHLILGEKLTILNLLYIMLMESSNDSAVALKSTLSDFVDLMNQKARELRLENTYFSDSTGINQLNYSTVSDLVRLTSYSFSNPLIWTILDTKEKEIYSQERNFKHDLINTNKLLGDIPEIIGGKTGFTDEAGGCMLIAIKIPNKSEQYLIIIVLGSKNRELEIQKLVEWINKAYVW